MFVPRNGTTAFTFYINHRTFYCKTFTCKNVSCGTQLHSLSNQWFLHKISNPSSSHCYHEEVQGFRLHRKSNQATLHTSLLCVTLWYPSLHLVTVCCLSTRTLSRWFSCCRSRILWAVAILRCVSSESKQLPWRQYKQHAELGANMTASKHRRTRNCSTYCDISEKACAATMWMQSNSTLKSVQQTLGLLWTAPYFAKNGQILEPIIPKQNDPRH